MRAAISRAAADGSGCDAVTDALAEPSPPKTQPKLMQHMTQ
jgi:hypothetical protein